MFHEGAIRMAAGEARRGKELVLQARKMNRAFDVTSEKEIASLLAADAEGSSLGAR